MTYSQQKPKQGRSIKQQIIMSFIVFTLVSLVVVSGTSIGFILLIGNTTTNQSTEALKTQIKENIISTAENNGNVVVSKLSNAEAMVRMMASQTVDAFAPESTYEYRTSYYNDPLNLPPDAVFDSNYGLNVSWDYSTFDFPGATPATWESLVTSNPTINETITNSAQMDYVFQMIHEAAPEFRWLYAGFENEGLFRNYPGSEFDIPDARTRGWYIDAKAAWVDNGYQDAPVVYTEAYADASDGVVLISIVQGIVDSDNQFVGVAAGDITVETIQEKILDIQVLESGYASLIQSDGLLVAHPDWASEPGNETIPNIENVEPLTPTQLTAVKASTSGVIEYKREGKDWFLAHVPILDGQYVVCVMVPVDEAIESVQDLQVRIQSSTTITIIEVAIIVAATAVLALFVGILTANRIVRPIQRLTDIASRMSTDTLRDDLARGYDFDIDEDLEVQDDEIGDLTRAFKGMIDSIKEESKNDK